MTGEWMERYSLGNRSEATCTGSAQDRIVASIGNRKRYQGGTKALRYRLPIYLTGRINQESVK